VVAVGNDRCLPGKTPMKSIGEHFICA